MLKIKSIMLAVASVLCTLDVLLILQHYTILSNLFGIKYLNLTINILAIMLLLFFSLLLNRIANYLKPIKIFLICVIIFFVFCTIF